MPRIAATVSAIAMAAVIGGTAAYTYLATPPACAGNSVAAGNSPIGGSFSLVTGAGQRVAETDVIDGPTLVYFGYTFCPDVCPFDVARNAVAVDLLSEMGHDVTPLFITIDPERDTPAVIAQYAEDMHPKMIALTGTSDEIAEAAQAYRVFYAKGAGEDDFYLMNHSTFTYLMFPGAGLKAYFGRSVSAEDMARDTACHIAQP